MQFSSHIKDDPRTRVREGTRRGSLCLLAILRAGFKQPPEAERSPDLSRDRSAITTRWINTRVVKVKWCYVVRCYWTRPVKIHDTDTLSRPPPAPAAGWDPAVIPRRGSSVEAFAHSADEPSLLTVNRAAASNIPLSLAQSRGPSGTRREFADVLVDIT